MRMCDPNCEFQDANICKLHSTNLDYVGIFGGKVQFVRCKECTYEKEELDTIEDLQKLEELIDAYEGIPDVTKDERRKRIMEAKTW